MVDLPYNKDKMSTIKFNNVGIRAISACVPKKISYNSDLRKIMSEDEVEKTVNSIGIKEKRIADVDTCSSDLCIKAAEKLFEDNLIDRNSIDFVLFLSQTPDYIIPATSPILQHKLRLPKTTACLDLNLGCSGFVYGLSTAFAYASLPGINRVLLLVGETFSKIVNAKDKVNAPLYGDAGTATLIEKELGKDSIFCLYSDGEGEEAVIIPSGGFRKQTSIQSLIEEEKEEGNIRKDTDLYMNGMDVFNFAVRVVPKGIKEIMAIVSKPIEDIDVLLFHQANKFMTDFFVKKLKIDANKVPYCIDKYGNTSAASIPLTIVSELNDINNKRIVLSGFGAGLSWGTVYLEPNNCHISKIIEY